MRCSNLWITLFLGASACTQTIQGQGPGRQSGGDSGQSGSTTTTGGSSGTGSGGSGASGTGGIEGGSAGTAGSGGVPMKPADVFVPTARATRLSRVQWSNTVRDLLGLADISEVERNITGDAVVGFDNDAESLFVSDA